jgi:hypothetical protein
VESPPVERGPELGLVDALALDETVERCWKCTERVKKAFFSDDPKDRPVRCAAVVDNCAAECALVRPAHAVLAPAAVAIALCDLSARCVDASAAGSSLTRVISCTDGCPPPLKGGSGAAGAGGGSVSAAGSGGGGMCGVAGTGANRDAAAAGEAGSSGQAGEGGMGGAPDPVVDDTKCFDERVRCTSTSFLRYAADCIDCARAQECSLVASQCKSQCEGAP